MLWADFDSELQQSFAVEHYTDTVHSGSRKLEGGGYFWVKNAPKFYRNKSVVIWTRERLEHDW